MQGEASPVDALVAKIAAAGGRSEIYLLPPVGPRIASVGDWHEAESLPVPLLRRHRRGALIGANRAARVLLPNATEPGTRILKGRGARNHTVLQVALGNVDEEGALVASSMTQTSTNRSRRSSSR